MKKIIGYATFLLVFYLGCVTITTAQNGKETYTGTVLIYGTGFNTRTVTRTFTLNITGQTSSQQAQNFLGILQESGQDDLLNAIKKENVGNFSIGGSLGRRVNVVRESTVNGKRRIFVVFERWLQFAELRGGYRSLDYPFSVLEMYVDERTGKGEGTFISAAKIRWTYDKNKEQNQIEIENFATFPGKLLGVSRR